MNKEISITIKSNPYTIAFPNVGQLLYIEVLKATISNGMYGMMQTSRTTDSAAALDFVDMEAYFTVLCPNLIKDLKVKSFRDLGVKDAMELRDIFVKQLLPFIQKWRDIISGVVQDDKSNE